MLARYLKEDSNLIMTIINYVTVVSAQETEEQPATELG